MILPSTTKLNTLKSNILTIFTGHTGGEPSSQMKHYKMAGSRFIYLRWYLRKGTHIHVGLWPTVSRIHITYLSPSAPFSGQAAEGTALPYQTEAHPTVLAKTHFLVPVSFENDSLQNSATVLNVKNNCIHARPQAVSLFKQWERKRKKD